jgi:hypothetical protein
VMSSCRAARCTAGTTRSPSPAESSARSSERGGRSDGRFYETTLVRSDAGEAMRRLLSGQRKAR